MTQESSNQIHDEESRLAAFHQALLGAGLVKRINPQRRGEKPRFQLIQVLGKPLSETIIEERR
jgi:hypothetical protein